MGYLKVYYATMYTVAGKKGANAMQCDCICVLCSWNLCVVGINYLLIGQQCNPGNPLIHTIKKRSINSVKSKTKPASVTTTPGTRYCCILYYCTHFELWICFSE